MFNCYFPLIILIHLSNVLIEACNYSNTVVVDYLSCSNATNSLGYHHYYSNSPNCILKKDSQYSTRLFNTNDQIWAGKLSSQYDFIKLVFGMNRTNFISINVEMTVTFDTSANCKDISTWKTVGVTIENHNLRSLDDSNNTFTSILDWRGATNSADFMICEIRLKDINVIYGEIHLKMMGLLGIVPGSCSDNSSTSLPAKENGFIWREGSKLMKQNKEFHFIGFHAPYIVNGSFDEQEDVIMAVSKFAGQGSNNIILSTQELAIVPENIDDYRNFETIYSRSILGPSPGSYHENGLKALDCLIALASKHGIRLYIPFFQYFDNFDFFSVRQNDNKLTSFYLDRQIINDFKDFLKTILTRVNSVSGIPYKQDPTIFAWVIGHDKYGLARKCPPTNWTLEIAKFIKSFDSDHLLAYNCQGGPGHSQLLPEELAIREIDIYEHRSTTLEVSDGPMLAKPFKKVFIGHESPLSSNTQNFAEYYNSLFLKSSRLSYNGIFINNIAGRKEKGGFFADKNTLFYPISKNLNQNQHSIIQVLVNLSISLDNIAGNKVFRSKSISYPPKIKKISFINNEVLEITWLGTVGARFYKLYSSHDAISYNEIYSIREDSNISNIIQFNTSRACDKLMYFKFIGFDSESQEIGSPAAQFNNSISNGVCLVKTVNQQQPLIYTIVAVVVLSAVFTALFLYNSNWRRKYLLSKMMMKSIPRSNRDKNISQQVLGQSQVVQIPENNAKLSSRAIPLDKKSSSKKEPPETPKTTSIAPKLKLDILKLKLDKNDKTFSVSLTINSSSQSKTVSVSKIVAIPGYLEMNILEDIMFDMTQESSRGGYSYVKKGALKSDKMISIHGPRDVAVKFYSQPDKKDANIEEEDWHKQFMFEVAIMSSLPESSNMVYMIGFSNQARAIIMPYYKENLNNYLQTGRFRLSSKKIYKIGQDISSGMRDLHNSKIIHLDLKPQNILVDLSDGNPRFLICDFGMANFIGSELLVPTGFSTPTNAGLTYSYASPELFEMLENLAFNRPSQALDTKIDVYAFSMTMYHVITQKIPFEGFSCDQIRATLKSGKRPQFEPSSRYEDLKKLLELLDKCWANDPMKRPEFTSIYNQISSL